MKRMLRRALHAITRWVVAAITARIVSAMHNAIAEHERAEHIRRHYRRVERTNCLGFTSTTLIERDKPLPE